MRVYLQPNLAIAILALLAAAVALSATGTPDPPADEVWPTKKVMDKIAVGKQSLLSVINKDLLQPEPDWKSDEQKLTEVIRLMSMLNRQKPPRGSQEDWDKLVRTYVDRAKAARQSVKEHRQEPARVALAKARYACEECHENHGIN